MTKKTLIGLLLAIVLSVVCMAVSACAKPTYKVSWTVSNNVTVEVDGYDTLPEEVAEGTVITFAVTPATDYKATVKINKNVVAANNGKYTFTVNGDSTVSITATEIPGLLPTDVPYGEEYLADANAGTWYYWSSKWEYNLPAEVTVSSATYDFATDTATFTYTSEGSVWYGMQMFYQNASNVVGKDYTVTCVITVETACEVTINGQVVSLNAGANDVSLTITEPELSNGNPAASFALLMGKSEGDVMVTANTVSIKGLKFVEVETVYDYDAELNNDFASEKELFGEYVYGSDGVATDGNDQSKTYAGGIGGLDQKNRYVKYTFTVTASGKADFVWSIAGSAWNQESESNDGIADMADHVAVTIDGKNVDVSNIELPAGTGETNEEIWWNIQQVIVKDVELTAGDHVFSCKITAAGGLNVGSMKIYFAADENGEPDPTPGEPTVEVIYAATGANLTVESEKVYFTVSGTWDNSKAAKADVEAYLAEEDNFYFDFQGNPYVITGSWDGDWNNYDIYNELSSYTITVNEDGTWTLKVDLSPLYNFAYTAHIGYKTDGDPADLKLGAEFDGITVTANDKKYTLVSVPGSNDGAKYWGCIGLRITDANEVVKSFSISAVDLAEKDGKPCYIITGESQNYTEDDFATDFQKMSDWTYIRNATTTVTLDAEAGTFEIVIDLSTLEANGVNLLTHVVLEGATKDVELKQGTDGVIDTLTVGGKVYTLKLDYATTWNRWVVMLVVEEEPAE